MKTLKNLTVLITLLFFTSSSFAADETIEMLNKLGKESTKEVGAAAARISRYEGMEAHARTGDVRLRKYGFSN